jgi:hypothetical protein
LSQPKEQDEVVNGGQNDDKEKNETDGQVKCQRTPRMDQLDSVISAFATGQIWAKCVRIGFRDVCPRLFHSRVEIRHEMASFLLPVAWDGLQQDKWHCMACGCVEEDVWGNCVKARKKARKRAAAPGEVTKKDIAQHQRPRLRLLTNAAWNYFDLFLAMFFCYIFVIRNASLKFFNRVDEPLHADEYTDFQYHLAREYDSIAKLSVCSIFLMFKLASYLLEVPGVNLIFGASSCSFSPYMPI